MSRWDGELRDWGAPERLADLADLSPMAAVEWTRSVATTVGAQLAMIVANLDEHGTGTPEWLGAALGAFTSVTDELDELSVYLDAFVPNVDTEPTNGNGRAPVPAFCNELPPDGDGAPCLNAPGHAAIEGNEHTNGKRTWPVPWPAEPEPDPAWRCVTCSNDASDPHAHEREHGHWPVYAD